MTGTFLPNLAVQGKESLIFLSHPQKMAEMLGIQLPNSERGVYVNGHERADVVEYRQKVVLPKAAELERRSYQYVIMKAMSADSGDPVTIVLVLP